EALDSRAAEQVEYWLEQLFGMPPRLRLPADRIRRPETVGRAALTAFELDERLRADVERLAARTGSSMFMILHAALAAVLTARGAGTDRPIGSLVAGLPGGRTTGGPTWRDAPPTPRRSPPTPAAIRASTSCGPTSAGPRWTR